MNARSLVNFQFNSAVARRLLAMAYREGRTYRVWFGPLRGCYLRYDRNITFHTMLGLSDLINFRVVKRLITHLGTAPIIADVGANIGMYSLWFSKTGQRASVHAWEPAPWQRELLYANLASNTAGNVVVVPRACGDSTGEVTFFLGEDHHCSSLDRNWATGQRANVEGITVPQTTLDEYFFTELKSGGPDLIKMDIEGGGVFALPGASRCFQEKRSLLLIESHTPSEDRAISQVLIKFNYAAFRIAERKWVTAPVETHPNPNGVWGTMLCVPKEKVESISKLL